MVCELTREIAVAIRKGFYTAKAARPDAYRAANYILRMAFDGRILMSMKPRGYYQQLQGEEEDERAQAGVPLERVARVSGRAVDTLKASHLTPVRSTNSQ